jgi:hypothetical protein
LRVSPSLSLVLRENGLEGKEREVVKRESKVEGIDLV